MDSAWLLDNYAKFLGRRLNLAISCRSKSMGSRRQRARLGISCLLLGVVIVVAWLAGPAALLALPPCLYAVVRCADALSRDTEDRQDGSSP